MAEIEIERRPRRHALTWVALLLVLAAVGVGAWLVFSGDTDRGSAAPTAETTTERPIMEPLGPEEATIAPPEGAGTEGAVAPAEGTPTPAAPEGDGDAPPDGDG